MVDRRNFIRQVAGLALTGCASPALLDNLGGGIGRLPDPKTRIRMRRLLHSYS